MKFKKGKISIVVFMLIAVIAGLLIIGIFGEPIKKAFAAVTDPLLKKVGLEEDDSEQQIVEEELLENAKEVFTNFKNVIDQCKNSKDLKCACGVMDFTQLNNYKILLSNKRVTGNTYLILLAPNGLPVDPQVQPEIPIDNFPTLTEDIYENSDKINDYNNKENYFRFSSLKIVYGIDGDEKEKFKDKMQNIYFWKPVMGATIFDDNPNNNQKQVCNDKCPSFTFCGDYNEKSCSDCGVARENDCEWIDYDDVDNECGVSYISSELKAPALIVKIDTGQDPTEVWDFRLTSNNNVEIGDGVTFRLDNFDHPDPGKECTVMAIRESGGADSPRVWYVKPGSLIEEREAGRLWNGFKGPVLHDCNVCNIGDFGDFCISKCPASIRASPNPSDSLSTDENTIGGEPYTTDYDNNCGKSSKTRCPLLDDIGTNKYWKPKYEILCDDSGYWNVCNANGNAINADGVTYTCQSGRWINGGENDPVGFPILHIKIDPEGKPEDTHKVTQTYSFHLTNDPGHDGKSGSSADYCNVYAINEEGSSVDPTSVWHINPGGRIVRTKSQLIDRISLGLDGYIAKADDNKASPYYRPGEETIGGKPYGIGKNTRCSDNDPECSLLVRTPDDKNNFHYWPKYGLICDNDKKWKICEEYVLGAELYIGSNQYRCINENENSDEGDFQYYTWIKI
jgi:hypothetical protein